MRVAVLIAARPNFVKAAPLIRGLRHTGLEVSVVHAGQHYDEALSAKFLDQLQIPDPELNLGVGSGSHAYQTAKTILGVEAYLRERRPDALVVVGDVNATMGGAIAAAKCATPLVHLEAGLRSFDRSMPEEINRVVTDQLSQLCLAPSDDAVENLRNEGVTEDRIALVGNCMIDTLLENLDEASALRHWTKLGLERGDYAVLTLHRPANVDEPTELERIVSAVSDATSPLDVVFPVHPRTAKNLHLDRYPSRSKGRIIPIEPLPYAEFLSLMTGARIVLTDSGGIQEETSILGIPCVTLRNNTERPITIKAGTNLLGGREYDSILDAVQRAFERPYPDPKDIPLWDGKAGLRSAEAIVAHLQSGASSIA